MKQQSLKNIRRAFLISITLFVLGSTMSAQQTRPDSSVFKPAPTEKLRLEFRMLLLKQQMSLSAYRPDLVMPTVGTNYLPMPDEPKPMDHLVKDYLNTRYDIMLQKQKRASLGGLAKYLGYASASAAVGLAAYHVYKYRKEYGLKKK